MIASGQFEVDEIDAWIGEAREQGERDLAAFVAHRLPEIWANALARAAVTAQAIPGDTSA